MTGGLPSALEIATLGAMGTARQDSRIGLLITVIMSVIAFVDVPPLSAQQLPQRGEPDLRATHALAYADCMSLARSNPEQALGIAARWEREGGDEGARHCRAIALLNWGSYADAAQQLETLAATTNRPGKRLKGELFVQAGQAWLIAGQTNRALSAQTRALELLGPEQEVLLDRAITLASAGDYWKAVDDLNDVIDQEPRHGGALTLRATAWRKLENLDLAQDDIDRAIAISPGSVDALLERGNIRLLQGDATGAAADWGAVIAAGPKSPAADSARENLAKMGKP